jgi:hypothetical protein
MLTIRMMVVVGLMFVLPQENFGQILGRRRCWTCPPPRHPSESVSKPHVPEGNIRRYLRELTAAHAIINWTEYYPEFKDKIDRAVAELDVLASTELFAELQRNPTVKEKLEKDYPAGALGRLMDQGSGAVFISQAEKFVKTLRREMFSHPTLTAIHMVVEEEDINKSFFAEFALKDDHRRAKSLPPTIRFTLGPKRANEKVPLMVHCLFAFRTVKDGKEYSKTLSFDLYLEKVEATVVKGVFVPVLPWKVRNAASDTTRPQPLPSKSAKAGRPNLPMPAIISPTGLTN